MKIATISHITSLLRVLQTFLPALLLWLLAYTAPQAQDLGQPAYSKLTWAQIQSTASQGIHETIGLTTDNKMYEWGTNYHFWIHSKAAPSGSSPAGYALVQTTPYYVPSPAGETVTKVGAAAANVYLSSGSATSWVATFGCLTQSGKLYGWGMNIGTFANAAAGWAPLPSGTSFTGLDSTLAKRTPQQLTILGESTFVDFSFSSISNFWLAIGASGKAYHIGANGNGTYSSSFAALPIPAGADPATFKYVRVWCPNGSQGGSQPVLLYLKGNDGKIYYSGEVGWGMAMGVPAYFSNANTNTYPDAGGSPPSVPRNLRTDIPQLVPFPAGEDIVKMEFSGGGRASETFYALSASGKAFASGLWGIWARDRIVSDFTNKRFFAYPLAKMPVLGTELDKTYIPSTADTLYTLKRFCEIAMPAGASKIIDIDDFGPSGSEADRQWRATLIVTDNNKAYWAGRQNSDYYIFPNYVQYSDPYFVGKCDYVGPVVTPSQTQWTVEAINYRGIAQLFAPSDEGGGSGLIRRFIVSQSGKGYFEGNIRAGSGLGKLSGSGGAPYAYQPMPIANEQLDLCNPNPGEAVAGSADPVPAVGAIDCSKTKLYPAPVAGVPAQVSLIVTVNVTTIGQFSPITVSGSGMTLPSNFSSVVATTTGIQTFHIPINYDGSTLTNAFQFTIGQAGGCTADLTTKPNKEITTVWSLTNCSAIMPGVLSK